MRPADCHNGEYAPVLVLEHCVMETLVEPYDDANVSITWAGREASPRTAPAAMAPQTEDAAWAGVATRGRGIAVTLITRAIARTRPPYLTIGDTSSRHRWLLRWARPYQRRYGNSVSYT